MLVTLDAKELLAAARLAYDKDQIRSWAKCLLIKVRHDKYTIVGSDGYKLIEFEHKLGYNAADVSKNYNADFLLDVEDVKKYIKSTDSCVTIGYVSRSYGNVKIPLLIKNSRSIGGTGILDDSIVKITIDKVIVYQQSNYRLPNMEIREASDNLKTIGYNYSTFEDGKNDFNCKTMKQAENHIDFLKGKRNREF